jgi:hypothetical protein
VASDDNNFDDVMLSFVKGLLALVEGALLQVQGGHFRELLAELPGSEALRIWALLLGGGGPLRLFILERRDVLVCKQPLAILEDEVHDGLAPVETLGAALPVMPWHMTDGDEVRPSFCVDEWLWERMAP